MRTHKETDSNFKCIFMIWFLKLSIFIFTHSSVELRKKSLTMVEKTASLEISNGYRREMTTEELINKFDMDEYGSTPPRTRIKNKTRDWDRKQKL